MTDKKCTYFRQLQQGAATAPCCYLLLGTFAVRRVLVRKCQNSIVETILLEKCSLKKEDF